MLQLIKGQDGMHQSNSEEDEIGIQKRNSEGYIPGGLEGNGCGEEVGVP
jgi:hypothetical protein